MKLVTPGEALSQVPDADLVARCAGAGGESAFHELTARYYRPVCGFLFKRLGQPDLVEDLAQETFLEAFQALRRKTGPAHFSSWLFGIAHNRCGKWFRRKKLGLYPANEPPEVAAAMDVSVEEEVEQQRKRTAALESATRPLPPPSSGT